MSATDEKGGNRRSLPGRSAHWRDLSTAKMPVATASTNSAMNGVSFWLMNA